MSSQFPQLSRPQARVLALWSLGVALAHRCGQSCVVAVLAPLLGQSEPTVRQRLREWCYAAPDKAGAQRQQIEVATCCTGLLGWVLRWWDPQARRLALALDASTLEARCTVLTRSVVYRSCAIPVAWVVVRAQEPGAWRPHWLRLLQQVQGSLPRDWLVVVLADRGLYAPWLYRAIVACGWHPLLRLTGGKGSGLYRLVAGGGGRPLARVWPQVGRAWCGVVVCFVEQSVTGTLLARWEPGHREGWLVLTDLPPASADSAWYGLRGWIEAGVKDLKRDGWQWQRTRMHDPARVSRFWLVLAVATLWVVSVGSDAEDAAPRSHLEALPTTHVARRATSGRAVPCRLSCFRRGITVITQALLAGHALPLGRFCPAPWPTHQASGQKPPGVPRKTYP